MHISAAESACVGDKSPLAKSNTALAVGFNNELKLAPEKDFDQASVQS